MSNYEKAEQVVKNLETIIGMLITAYKLGLPSSEMQRYNQFRTGLVDAIVELIED